MYIDSYSFGRIVINNKTYTSDVIIYPDRVDPSWWRKEGHNLQEVDLADIVKALPKVLIIGTGYYGVMKVPKTTTHYIESHGMKLFIEKTGKAVELFNKLSEKDKTVCAFHLTC